MDYFEEYERLTDELQLVGVGFGNAGQSYNFEVGDIVLEIDRSDTDIANVTDIDDVTNIADIANYSDVADITEGSRIVYEGDSAVFGGSDVLNERGAENKAITVNFNAYNQIDSSGADIDAVIDAFGERLAGIIASAAEGVHL